MDDLQRAGLTDPTVFHRWKHCFTAEHSSTVFQKFLPVKFGGIFFYFLLRLEYFTASGLTLQNKARIMQLLKRYS